MSTLEEQVAGLVPELADAMLSPPPRIAEIKRQLLIQLHGDELCNALRDVLNAWVRAVNAAGAECVSDADEELCERAERLLAKVERK